MGLLSVRRAIRGKPAGQRRTVRLISMMRQRSLRLKDQFTQNSPSSLLCRHTYPWLQCVVGNSVNRTIFTMVNSTHSEEISSHWMIWVPSVLGLLKYHNHSRPIYWNISQTIWVEQVKRPDLFFIHSLTFTNGVVTEFGSDEGPVSFGRF